MSYSPASRQDIHGTTGTVCYRYVPAQMLISELRSTHASRRPPSYMSAGVLPLELIPVEFSSAQYPGDGMAGLFPT